ncbi:hypothetical protein L249_6650 [Ophiocordyceps polyrhachis-furcata BCC 54312]|uniref:Uncharacterized protein n=1 Tax=Ophiocordyceps polyrhachis-furcata BCC 54312 TaxID=1330021 RepID=A0A367LL17_9HYPO|nr:hypothetical protein L249_6650 [Ophiocordyceps polyrhachis-furcata BCC 54312]
MSCSFHQHPPYSFWADLHNLGFLRDIDGGCGIPFEQAERARGPRHTREGHAGRVEGCNPSGIALLIFLSHLGSNLMSRASHRASIAKTGGGMKSDSVDKAKANSLHAVISRKAFCSYHYHFATAQFSGTGSWWRVMVPEQLGWIATWSYTDRLVALSLLVALYDHLCMQQSLSPITGSEDGCGKRFMELLRQGTGQSLLSESRTSGPEADVKSCGGRWPWGYRPRYMYHLGDAWMGWFKKPTSSDMMIFVDYIVLRLETAQINTWSGKMDGYEKSTYGEVYINGHCSSRQDLEPMLLRAPAAGSPMRLKLIDPGAIGRFGVSGFWDWFDRPNQGWTGADKGEYGDGRISRQTDIDLCLENSLYRGWIDLFLKSSPLIRRAANAEKKKRKRTETRRVAPRAGRGSPACTALVAERSYL